MNSIRGLALALSAALVSCSGSSGAIIIGAEPGAEAGVTEAGAPPDGGSAPGRDAAVGPGAGDVSDASLPQPPSPLGSPDGGSDSGHATADAGHGGADAGSPVPVDAGGSVDPCAGGTLGTPSDGGSPQTQVQGYGLIDIASPDDDPIVALTTTLRVPPTPPASGTVFVWPGLQPSARGASYLPIDNGSLQSVLTWGPTCAPTSPSPGYGAWWISAQYVNTTGHDPGHMGCLGGSGMSVAVDDLLAIAMTLSGNVWSQSVTSTKTGKSVTFAIDMKGQSQNYAELMIAGYNQEPTAPLELTSTVITFQKPSAASCQPFTRGITDDFSTPRASADGTRCCYQSITLRPKGL